MIENRETLTDHGNRAVRATLLDVAEAALERVHPSVLVPEAVAVDGRTLRVRGTDYDLDSIEAVHVIGAGKGSFAVVRALLETVDRRVPIGDAVVIEKRGQGGSIPGVEVHEAGHPIPDEAGLRASDRVLEVARAAGPDDLVIACITGGASALLVRPVDAVPFADLAALTDRLLRAGCRIEEVNAVRKHCSAVKGGRLARTIAPARSVSLIVVDEVAGEPWGPTVPDETTFADAIGVLRRYGLWDDLSRPIREHLERGATDPGLETPGSDALADGRSQTVVLADATDVCEAAAEAAGRSGYEPLVLSTGIEGESRTVGTVLAGIAKEAARYGRPAAPPCVLVSGGETTVTLDGGDGGGSGDRSTVRGRTDGDGTERAGGDSKGDRDDRIGSGGPNQELALRTALEIDGYERIGALAIGTDGTDGPTDVAGGLVDGGTAQRARARGVSIHDRLRRHDSTGALRALDDAVYTGATGTNVMDLRLLLVEPRSPSTEPS